MEYGEDEENDDRDINLKLAIMGKSITLRILKKKKIITKKFVVCRKLKEEYSSEPMKPSYSLISPCYRC